MRTTIIAIGLAALAGILSWLWFHSPRLAPTLAIEASTTREPKGLSEHEIQIGGESMRSRIEPDVQVEPGKLESSAVAEVTARLSEHDQESDALPSLRRCLLDPELNPDGLDCPNPNVREELEHLIVELNLPLLELADSRRTLVNQIAVSKVASGLDPRATWGSIPDDQILYRCGVSNYANGHLEQGSTVILKGERPELEEVLEKIIDSKREAREKLKERIGALCRG